MIEGGADLDAGLQKVTIAGEDFELYPERCALRVSDRTMIAADLHWGKAEVFQQSGIAIPSLVLGDDLQRLSKAIFAHRAKRLLLLGDLIHARSGITEHVHHQIVAWREKHRDLPIILVRGNHDRGFTPPSEWRIEIVEGDLNEPPFVYTHEPPDELDFPQDEVHYWCGHLHPTIALQGRRDSLRLPCFAIGKKVSILPAFSRFTGGFNLRRSDWSDIFVVADDLVLKL